MRRYYHADLVDLFRGRLTHRQVSVWIDRLPVESALNTEIRDALSQEQLDALAAPSGGEVRWGPWSHTDQLLARIVDSIAWLRWESVMLQSSGKPPPAPEPLPRPGVPKAPSRRLISPEGRAYLEHLLDQNLQQMTGA